MTNYVDFGFFFTFQLLDMNHKKFIMNVKMLETGENIETGTGKMGLNKLRL